MSRERSIAGLEDERLLTLRFNALGLSLAARHAQGRELRARLARLDQELARKGLRFRPHTWLSSDFFSPDGVPGFALPFYLASPRLVRLERAQSLDVEGHAQGECMRLLRHEAGHAFDTAYGLHLRADWRALFGLRSTAYLRSYQADPRSPDHVRYLPNWYAQSHPAEDFAESFAVWLDPRSAWRRAYPSGAAREKLEWIERIARELAAERPLLRSSEETERIQDSEETLAQHYAARRRRRLREPRLPFAAELEEAFEAGPGPLQGSDAAAHLLGSRAAIQRGLPAAWRRDDYALEQVLGAMALHCRQRGLCLGAKGRPPGAKQLAGWVHASLQALASGQARLAR